MNGIVYALTRWNDAGVEKLVIGGSFSIAGNTLAQNIASWDGTSWSPIGSGVNGTVRALAIYGGQLVAGGSFTKASDIEARRIAQWNGSNWQPLGTGMNSDIYALAEFNGDLYAGGRFTTAGTTSARSIARWNGSQWNTLGGATLNGPVYALISYNAELIVGGDFSTIQFFINIARWTGTEWRSFQPGVPADRVTAFTLWNDQLVVGASRPAGVFCWDGTSLSAVGSQFTTLDIDALCVSNGSLFAGGFLGISINGGTSIARWDGAAWQPMGGFLAGSDHPIVYALCEYQGKLVLGGDVTGSFSAACRGLVRWEDGHYVPFEGALAARISALAVYHGELYAGSSVTRGPDDLANNIGRWDGQEWRAVGFGGPIDRFACFAEFRDELIVGGTFFGSSDPHMGCIAKFDGATWSPLGGGIVLPPGVFKSVNALTVAHDKLIAAGVFNVADGIPANNLAQWDGASWSGLDSGMNLGIDALTTFHGDPVAAGLIYVNGQYVTRISRWNGSAWHPLGDDCHGNVFALAVYNEDLIAAGTFTTIGMTPINRIARWNGTSWNPLGQGISQEVHSLLVHGDDLIVGGIRYPFGSVPALGLSRWDGMSWSLFGDPLGNSSGLAVVFALQYFSGDVVVGGEFDTAGNQVSANWARWSPSIRPPAISLQPTRQTIPLSQPATFQVAATGGQPLAYQWRKNGEPITDTANISGTQTDTLTIASVTQADTGQYDCVISNDCGATTSNPARLNVLIPTPGPRQTAPAQPATPN